jgi:hypothetical protein
MVHLRTVAATAASRMPRTALQGQRLQQASRPAQGPTTAAQSQVAPGIGAAVDAADGRRAGRDMAQAVTEQVL